MFMKANGKKLYEEVAGQIKHLIETKQLNSGDMLPSEEEMSKSIGVGRSTIREALRSLELNGRRKGLQRHTSRQHQATRCGFLSRL